MIQFFFVVTDVVEEGVGQEALYGKLSDEDKEPVTNCQKREEDSSDHIDAKKDGVDPKKPDLEGA